MEWKCRCGAVLGTMQRDKMGVRELSVIPGLTVKVEGCGTRVFCPACFGSRVWMPGEEALRELFGECGEGVLVRFDELEEGGVQ